MSYTPTNTCSPGASAIVASAPSQPRSSPPKVSRQPSSQPVPAMGEWGHLWCICAGSRLLPYAA